MSMAASLRGLITAVDIVYWEFDVAAATMRGKGSPFGFVLHPRTREELKLTLLTPFSKDRPSWATSECMNTRDGSSYRLDRLPPRSVITLGDVLCGYLMHNCVDVDLGGG